jgi:hypothetical protein
MPRKPLRPYTPHLHAAIEIAFIVFLFYSNLLMGEFTRSNPHHRTLAAALYDIVTMKNLAIAIFTAALGHFFFELLRKKT